MRAAALPERRRAIVLRPCAVDERREARLKRRQDRVGLGLREAPGRDCGCDLRLLCRHERVDQAGGGLAARRAGDLGEGLARLQLRRERALGQPEVVRGSGEVIATMPEAATAWPVAVVAGRARAAGGD